jgi:hypothetical protein
MYVLLACDIDTDGKGNPYTLQLLHAMETHLGVAAVQHGTSWMLPSSSNRYLTVTKSPRPFSDFSCSDKNGLIHVPAVIAAHDASILKTKKITHKLRRRLHSIIMT